VVQLANNSDVLIHESAGASMGHSSASQAGQIAKDAQAKQLYLIHYPNGNFKDNNLLSSAKGSFGGPVKLAVDFMEFEF
jgi:ribonuclease BN (tRNA processing enzyme)